MCMCVVGTQSSFYVPLGRQCFNKASRRWKPLLKRAPRDLGCGNSEWARRKTVKAVTGAEGAVSVEERMLLWCFEPFSLWRGNKGQRQEKREEENWVKVVEKRKRGKVRAEGVEGGRLKDRCKYLGTLIELLHFCRKISYCSFSGGKGGCGWTVQILPMLGCVRQLNRTGFFCLWLSCQVSVALIAPFTKNMLIIQVSVRIAGYLGKSF